MGPRRMIIEIDAEIDAIKHFLEDTSSRNLSDLLGLWRSRKPEYWSLNSEPYQMLGERLLNLGEPLIAYDVLADGLTQHPQDLRLRQLLALSLARSGATQRANTLLNQLYTEGHKDEETLGILARTYKDLWTQTKESKEGKGYLKEACKYCTKAYRLTHGYFSGINAASTSLMLGKKDQALDLALKVRDICLNELRQMAEDSAGRYWLLATLGEAALISERCSEAVDWYSQASEVGCDRFGDLNSTRKQARLLLEYVDCERESIEKCFRIPKVVVFAGHMIDRPGRVVPRFPLQLEHAVYKAILKRLKKMDVGFGYASLACGADILFLESILELGGEAFVVLPYDKEQFSQDSVDIIPGADWRERYQRVLDQATQVSTASSYKLEWSGVSYDYANLILLGLAKNKAVQLETELVPMAVWDGNPGDGPGGTADIVRQWRGLGYTTPEVIDPAKITRKQDLELKKNLIKIPKKKKTLPSELLTEFSAEIKAILFADAVKFSRLTEKEIECFVRHFMEAIARLIADSSYSPKIKNTWGDGLYFVFSSVRDAGLFALELCDLIGETNWIEKGLPDTMNLRIALHAGPVVSCTEPITGAKTCMGTHVSHAARIEPITPPGQVYASQAFAALASAENIKEFVCEYIGQTPLAKGYGTFPTYLISKKRL